MNKELDFNYSECIKNQNNIGETIYHNICNGETYKVKVGNFDMFLVIIVTVLLISIISGMIVLIVDTIRE